MKEGRGRKEKRDKNRKAIFPWVFQYYSHYYIVVNLRNNAGNVTKVSKREKERRLKNLPMIYGSWVNVTFVLECQQSTMEVGRSVGFLLSTLFLCTKYENLSLHLPTSSPPPLFIIQRNEVYTEKTQTSRRNYRYIMYSMWISENTIFRKRTNATTISQWRDVDDNESHYHHIHQQQHKK